MFPYHGSRVTKYVLLVFFALLLAYGYFEARGFLLGPRIDMPDGKTEVHEPLVSIQGSASHIASLTMNGSPIPVTEDGAFDEPYLLADGLNRIVLEAEDKYGHTSMRVLQIVYVPAAVQNSITASSTAAASPSIATSSSTSTPDVAQ